MDTPLFNYFKSFENEFISIRRHLHQHPELSFQEYNTTQYIIDVLESWGITQYQRLCETGVVLDIQGENPDTQCIALRADIDALPIQEANNISYKSINDNCMHACGHDVHTTVLLAAVKYLFQHKNTFSGTIRCIFQAGEELSPGGASILIDKGVLTHSPSVQKILGLHVFPEFKVGEFGFKPGPYMASADEIHITIHGQSGHAALPHKNHDPLDITQHILSLLQSQIIKKNNPLNPCVLNFGHIAGGDSTNVIPEIVTMKGTLRTFDETWRQQCKDIIYKTCDALSQLFELKIEVHIPPGYPYLHNDENFTHSLMKAAEDITAQHQVKLLDKRMTAEDFSFYAQKIPACFFRLGTNSPDNQFSAPVHNNRFNIDESSIVHGATMMVHLALKSLNA